MAQNPGGGRRTSTRKAAGSAADTETPQGDQSPPDATGDPSVDDPTTDPASSDPATDPASSDPASSDPASSDATDPASSDPAERLRLLRARQAEQVRTTQRIDTGNRPTTLTPQQLDGQSGISPHSVGGPDLTVERYAAGQTARDLRGDYVFPDSDAYVAFRPMGCRTLATKRVWSAGLAVRKDYYNKMLSHVSPTPEGAQLYPPEGEKATETAEAGGTATSS
jgi:hypothetical protein